MDRFQKLQTLTCSDQNVGRSFALGQIQDGLHEPANKKQKVWNQDIETNKVNTSPEWDVGMLDVLDQIHLPLALLRNHRRAKQNAKELFRTCTQNKTETNIIVDVTKPIFFYFVRLRKPN